MMLFISLEIRVPTVFSFDISLDLAKEQKVHRGQIDIQNKIVYINKICPKLKTYIQT